MADKPEFVKVGAQTANWSAEEGKSVFETVLKANDNDIQIVFAQNDEMGLGAAQAVEEAGLVPGTDVHDRHDRRHQGRDGGARRRQAQLRRRVQPAVRPDARSRSSTRCSPVSRVEPYIIVPSTTFDSPEAAAGGTAGPAVLTDAALGPRTATPLSRSTLPQAA